MITKHVLYFYSPTIPHIIITSLDGVPPVVLVASDELFFIEYSSSLHSGVPGRGEWAAAEIESAATNELPDTGRGF